MELICNFSETITQKEKNKVHFFNPLYTLTVLTVLTSDYGSKIK